MKIFSTTKIPEWDFIKLGCFIILYLILFIPLLIAIVREFQIVEQEQIQVSIMSGSGLAMVIWLGTISLLYLLLWCLGKAGFKVNHKTSAQHRDDLLRMLYYGIVMASLGGVAGRIDNQNNRPYFPVVVAYYCIVFAAMFELVRDYNIQLSTTTATVNVAANVTKSVVSGIVVVSGVAICMLVIASHVYSAFRVPNREFLTLYANLVIGCLVVHAILFLPMGIRSTASIHVHHWYWSLPLAHMCIFNTDVSMISQAMFLGIHIHGVSCFGIEQIFYDSIGNTIMPARAGTIP